MRGNRLFVLGVKKDRLTTLWALFLAVVFAILIVKMNALAAACRCRNVVSFFPADGQETTVRPSNSAEHIPVIKE